MGLNSFNAPDVVQTVLSMPKKKKRKFPSMAKAKKILKDKTIRGNLLTPKQKRFFGFIAGGGKPSKKK